MSANHLFGSKKRNSSILYGTDQTKAVASTSSFEGSLSHSNIRNHGDGFPPNKRYKSLAGTDGKELEDPFGDSDDFTADDLEEIDVIASQALPQSTPLKTNTAKTEWSAELSSPKNNAIKSPDNFKPWNIALNTERKSKGQCGSSTEDTPFEDKFRLETLQAQYEEAKKRLKEMQDDILMKNGEIRILRDSMKKMETTVEEQRKLQAILEKEKNETLNEKEKEFSRKLQSLQSELQFRDAEMNELKTKLLNCERIKSVTPSVSHTSPKKSPRSIMKIEGCTQNEKKGCPTKESFGSEIPAQASSSKPQLHTQTFGVNKDSKTPDHETKPLKEKSKFICAQKPGAILMNALMKEPVVPGSSFGLCYLISSNVKVCPGPAVQSSSSNPGSTENFSGRTSSFQEKESSLRIAQKLALTGLNLIALDEGSLEESSEEDKKEITCLRCCKIPGGTYLLPLLEYHIAAYHQALMLPMKMVSTMSGDQSTPSSIVSSNATTSSADEVLSTLEELAVVSLGILYHLVFHSWEVVSVLLNRRQEYRLGDAEILEKDKLVCRNQHQTALQGPDPELDVTNDDPIQHPLFKRMLQLLPLCSTAAVCQRHNILCQCLRILVKLAERSTVDLLISFQHLLNRQAQPLFRCMSSESPVFATHLTVQLLTLLAQHQELAAQFCTCSESCLFLALYTYITSRPDKSASEVLWLQLEQETVRLLIKCMQCCSTSILLVGTDCQCKSEVVKAVIIMLHRQWLTLRRDEGNLFEAHGKQVVQFLRDTVLLLHRLSQKDKLFHDHCLEVLHQYDHIMPGIRAILQKVPDLKACEELALDELCSLEPEVEDQEMECS